MSVLMADPRIEPVCKTGNGATPDTCMNQPMARLSRSVYALPAWPVMNSLLLSR
jgi:hypothetical protein